MRAEETYTSMQRKEKCKREEEESSGKETGHEQKDERHAGKQ